jgi:hypothetical protein
MMLVVCEAPDGTTIEGAVVHSDGVNPATEEYLLDGIFTVLCEDGARFKVCGCSWTSTWRRPWPNALEGWGFDNLRKHGKEIGHEQHNEI